MPVLEPKNETVEVNGTLYCFNLLPARKQGKISNKLIGKAGLLFAVLNTPQGLEALSSQVNDFLSDETTDLLYELIFAPEANLSVITSGRKERILDVDLYFQGKYMEMLTLCYKALEVNCQDFFIFIRGFMEKVTLSETFSKMQDEILSKLNPTQTSSLKTGE